MTTTLPKRLPFRCTDCGHIQQVSVVYRPDGVRLFGSGATFDCAVSDSYNLTIMPPRLGHWDFLVELDRQVDAHQAAALCRAQTFDHSSFINRVLLLGTQNRTNK